MGIGVNEKTDEKEFIWEDLLESRDMSVISLLHGIQERFDYLPEQVLREVAEKTGTPLIEIYRIATFYKYFSLNPKGKYKILTCSGTACHVRNSEQITDEISRLLNIETGSTTEDGLYSLEKVNCLGACALAPLVVIDHEYHGNMTPAKAQQVLKSHNGEVERHCACKNNSKMNHEG